MSLLLEALKKAEKAKEEAQRRARGEPADSAAPAAAEAERKPVLTRDKLPDISTPLEIASEDLAAVAPATEKRPALEIVPDPAPSAPPPPPQRPAAAAAADEQATRSTARKVFEAKFREPNPRMPFFITLGALGVFAVGTVIYFWIQLRPPYPLVNTNPARGQEQRVAEAPPSKPAAAAPSGAPAAGAVPGLPVAALPSQPKPAPTPPAAPAASPRLQPEPAPAVRAPAPRALAGAPAPRTITEPQASVTRAAPQVHPAVNAGYTAYSAGDLGGARKEYEQALRDEPGNRDALLGLAALEVRSGRYEAAEGVYLRLLQIDPRDAQAQAALIGLRSPAGDPLVTESRVKSLLAADPGAHALNFTLGNQLAAQNRWNEAQQEYFKAYSADPENADFAYNLAVSLDHLRQPKNALQYYQRALVLAEKRGAAFDLQAARSRAAELGQ